MACDDGGFEGQGGSGLVSGMWRFWGAGRGPEGAGRVADSEPRRGDHQRHRLFVELSRVHQYVWHAHVAWPRARGGYWCEAGEPRFDGDGDWGRWGRLRHRRQSLHAHHAAQRGPALHRDGQPDLRTHDGPDVTDEPRRHEDEEHAVRKYRVAGESDFA